ncbi:Outer membrane receptor proteins, mostly Fe transport [Polaribacter sp. KT25b]|uniref:outer membrane beta-barrel family protein n=1 Tax=Polaribacter sp. KT25b TaxID=1855336 RepID=UPI00087D75A9|nr:outer membrane beta-barrel family protein [Polaribacter sp. KT25b]SDR92024.1 Outer membrane receptor proteins, mostly Fe transport [Polaribacter sp. KT25b]
MNLKKNVFLLLAFIVSQFTVAQISGKIVDSGDNYPLEYASVALYQTNNKALVTGVVTNFEGLFSFTDVKPGNYYIEASFIGYQVKTITSIVINKKGEKKDIGTLTLVLGSGNQLNEVVVKSEKSAVIHKIDRQVFDTKKYQSTVGGNAVDVVKNLPSVTVDGLGEISVRGSKGFSVLINGKPTQGDASAILAQLPANAIESIELITAPSAKYDPEGKGGILNIITKKGAINGTFAQVNVRGGFPAIEDYDTKVASKRYGIDATINKRTDNWNLSFGASYQRNDKSGRREGDMFIVNQAENKTTFLPSDGERSFDEVTYNGRFNVDYTPNKSDSYSLGLFAGKRTKERLADIVYYDNHSISPIGGSTRDYTFAYYNHNLRIRKGDFALGSFDYAHKFNNESKISTSVLYEYTFLGGPTENDNLGHPDNNIVYQKEYNTNDNPLYGARFNLDYLWKPFSFGTLETGYQYRDLDHTGKFVYERDGVQVDEFSSDVSLKRSIHAGYAQITGSKSKWDYAAGLRLEAMDRTYKEALQSETTENVYDYDFVKLFPSASLQYKIDDKTNIKTAYSKRVERTTTFMMNSFAEREHSEVFEQGDNTLLPEFIDLVELGITKKLKGGNSIYATAYFRHVNNVINRVNTLAYEANGAVIDSIINRVYSNVGKSKSIGLEVGATIKPTSNWSNSIGANVYNYVIDGILNFKHRDGVERNYDIDSKSTIYSFNVNSTYNFWKNASLQFTFNYLSDRNTAMGEDSRFYSPNLTFIKKFMDDKLTATLQWQNIDMGLLNTNEQRISTSRPDQFYTTTNYVYEVDMVSLNLSYTFNAAKNKSKFIDSEFGKREF